MDYRFSRRRVGQLALASASAAAFAGQARPSLARVRLQPSWYFAEGSTMRGVDEYLTIVNPNNATAQVFVKYYLGYGSSISMGMSVPKGRMTIPVYENRAGGIGRGQEPIGVVLESMNDIDFVVERPMYFSYGAAGWTGGHVVLGVAAPRRAWYFAEGYTASNFDEYLTIQNPSATDTDVRISYYLRGGDTRTRLLRAPANARTTVAVHDSAQGVGRGQEVSALVESLGDVGIIVERPMYFDYAGGDSIFPFRADGGHVTAGFALD